MKQLYAEIGCKNMKWIELDHCMIWWQVLLLTVLDIYIYIFNVHN
jgi:hypothetical protein